MVFKNNAMYSLNFIGGASVFSSRKVTDSFGMAGPNCAVDIGGQLVVLTPTDVILTDGQSFKSIATNQVQRYLQTLLGQGAKCWAVYDEATGNVILALVKSGFASASTSFVWNKFTQLWSFHGLVKSQVGVAGVPYATYGALPGTGVQPQQVVGVEVTTGGTGGYVTLGTNNLYLDGTAITGTCHRFLLDLGEPDAVKTVTRVDLNVKCSVSATLLVRISGRMVEDDPNFSTTLTADSNRQVPCFVVGRLISLEIECAEPGWECHGFGLVTGVGSPY